jgi:hypothetical protein
MNSQQTCVRPYTCRAEEFTGREGAAAGGSTAAARAILAAERNELHAIGVAMQAQTHQELVERIDMIEQHYVNQAPFRKAGQWP